jgi:hypothetical protein
LQQLACIFATSGAFSQVQRQLLQRGISQVPRLRVDASSDILAEELHKQLTILVAL